MPDKKSVDNNSVFDLEYISTKQISSYDEMSSYVRSLQGAPLTEKVYVKL